MKTTRRVVISLAVGALTLRGLTFSTVAVAQQKGDYAVAMIDKIEKPQFINRRFRPATDTSTMLLCWKR